MEGERDGPSSTLCRALPALPSVATCDLAWCRTRLRPARPWRWNTQQELSYFEKSKMPFLPQVLFDALALDGGNLRAQKETPARDCQDPTHTASGLLPASQQDVDSLQKLPFKLPASHKRSTTNKASILRLLLASRLHVPGV